MATKTRGARRATPAAQKGKRVMGTTARAKSSTSRKDTALKGSAATRSTSKGTALKRATPKGAALKSSTSKSTVLKGVTPKRLSPKSSTRKRSAPKAPRTTTAAKREAVPQAEDLRTLYPPIKPNLTGYLRVSDLHEIYYEESGNSDGKPAVFVHGGPGGGTDAKMRSFFDPKRYRIILFDQRGCGKSRPNASLVDNTTWHLVEDMEKLREHLGIEEWLVFGGSWGSTLALAYAETHPQRVTELVLRGIFLLRRWEIEWFYQNPAGAGALFPDLWERYVAPIPEDERSNMVSAYYKRLTSDDPQMLGQAAQAWSVWEGATSYLRLNPDYVAKFGEDIYAATFARIECHYFINKGFFKTDAQLLEDVHRIRHIPAVIVQGRYDVICPMKSAWDLHRAWPEADLRVVPDAGHSAFEAGNIHELVSATDRFARSR
jgi:proline iminopeptidase